MRVSMTGQIVYNTEWLSLSSSTIERFPMDFGLLISLLPIVVIALRIAFKMLNSKDST